MEEKCAQTEVEIQSIRQRNGCALTWEQVKVVHKNSYKSLKAVKVQTLSITRFLVFKDLYCSEPAVINSAAQDS